ncbi:TetR/AcrR family transcriptional regulator C-terminal domain-containing protein [Variovorax sp. ZT5P30]|uniref:TetR/AcrR family transcriptional regulator C-terminal domain-containing protein n=1 Tax=Variovorax sp. ZT5P30 TaxID=3443735 RepID=UPI003F458FB2
MRVKTEAKRDAIVQVASEVFRELGFKGASIVEIAARVGGSRATLYGYFSSKEELFVAVIHASASKHFGPIFTALAQEGEDDLAQVLQRFGEKVLAVVCSQEVIQAHRAVIAESGRSDIGRLFYEGGPKKGVTAMADFLAQQMHKGRLRPADPVLAAHDLMSLLDSQTVKPSLFGIQGPLTRKELREATRHAVQVFLGGYAAGGKTAE